MASKDGDKDPLIDTWHAVTKPLPAVPPNAVLQVRAVDGRRVIVAWYEPTVQIGPHGAQQVKTPRLVSLTRGQFDKHTKTSDKPDDMKD